MKNRLRQQPRRKNGTRDWLGRTYVPWQLPATVVGDSWTCDLREIFMANHRFAEITAQTGATPPISGAPAELGSRTGLVKRVGPHLQQATLRHE